MLSSSGVSRGTGRRTQTCIPQLEQTVQGRTTASHPKNTAAKSPPCFTVETLWSLVFVSTQFPLLHTTFIAAQSQAFQHSLRSSLHFLPRRPKNQATLEMLKGDAKLFCKGKGKKTEMRAQVWVSWQRCCVLVEKEAENFPVMHGY